MDAEMARRSQKSAMAPGDAAEMGKGTTAESTALHREFEDIDDFAYGTSVATCSTNVRLGFLRKVYSIITFQLLLTTLISATYMLVVPVRKAVLATEGPLMILALVGVIGTMIGLMCLKNQHPQNMYLLTAFTAFEGHLVGMICARYAVEGLGYLVLEAFVITMVIFCGITAYCFVSRKDFSFLGGFLFAGLLAILGATLVNLLLGVTGNYSPGFAFIIAVGGALLFTGFILYDTSVIMEKLSPDEYILACVNLYLDVLNLFLYILQILSRAQDR